jgi:arginyl-tRNA synthetase
VTRQEDDLRAELTRAARAIGASEDFDPVLERPRDPSFGDWATSAAMVLARVLRKKPRDIAEALLRELHKERAGVSSAEIAGPGFINFRVASDAMAKGLATRP